LSKLDKRAISILVIAILALSFVLPLVSVSAAPAIEFDLGPTGGIAEWSDSAAKTGFFSAYLSDQGIGYSSGTDYGAGLVMVPVNILLADIDSLSFWFRYSCPVTHPNYYPYMILQIDIDGNLATSDPQWLVMESFNVLYEPEENTWIQWDLDAFDYWHDAGYANIGTLENLKGVYPTARVVYGKVGVGEWSSGTYDAITAYIDDIEIDGVTYPLEKEVLPSDPDFSIDFVTPGPVEYGDVLNVIGSDVTAGSEVKIFWDYASGTYVHLLNTTEGNPDGTFDCTVTVPSDVVGDHYLWATDVSTGATVSRGPMTMVPKIKLSPSSGLFGEEVTVKGYGFSAESDITVTFHILPPLTTTVETDELGYFAYDFDVPIAIYKTYPVVATDEKSYTDSADFTVGASITLDVDEGPEGTRVEISGVGFSIGLLGPVLYDDTITMPLIGDPVDVGTSKKFTCEVIIPSTGSEGDHEIKIVDNLKAITATFTVDGLAAIEVEPTYGAPGSTITLTGANFTQIADIEVVLTLTHVNPLIADAPLGTVETNSDGTFETTFQSPAVTFENYKVEAVDAVYGLNALDSFKVGMIAMIINPTYGPSGSAVSLTGVGYAEGDFNMTFGEVLFEYENGVSPTEIIAEIFYVPTLDPGTYDVTVVDEVENELTAQFQVTAKTYVVFDPAQAPNEYDVIIEGYHFTEDPAADLEFILYNSTEFWDITADVDEYDPDGETESEKYLTSSAILADGNFTAWWTVPIADDLSLGDYTLNVTADDSFIQASFSVVQARVDVAPRKALFDRGDTIQFNVKNDFDFEDSYMKIWDPYDNLYWRTEEFDTWLKVGTLYTVPYYLQTSGMNPMILSQDAPIGDWFYIFYETGTTQLTNGTFKVGPSSAAQVEEKLTEIWGSIDELTTNIDSITDELAGDISDLSGDIDDVVADVQDMVDDITADLAEELAGVAEDTEAAVGELEDAIGDIASAQSELADDIESSMQTSIDAKEAAEAAKGSAQALTTLVYGAIAASLIAALAAVVSLMQISKKIA